jgi:hypothetical protein
VRNASVGAGASGGTSKAGGTISQQAAVYLWLAADAHGNKQTRYKLVLCLSTTQKIHNIKDFLSFIKYVPYQKTFEITDTCFNEDHMLLMFIIPTYAQTNSVIINIKITLTCFSVNVPSSGSLQVLLAEVMNY